ncbi:hypothetical protein LTR37_004487 [Vermiconidia calcicola]|uniref:Uncharacterized protein n=1 Tax=Vermiconidia calcicola TaxID=1690605 RepID=A0ACC3NM91_9PEZI|nr:hypothetical protein LTR37_004487 [Vermiconidia calcicola]
MTSSQLPNASAALNEPPSSIERVEAWTVAQVADVLSATSISSPTPVRSTRGASVKIDIPLDESAIDDEEPPRRKSESVHTVYKRREPIRRDSLKRREALLKGKEGSRQRRRWENDRLLGNPHAAPPLPSDWEVPGPQYRSVPYFLAPLWDAEYSRSVQQRKKEAEAAKVPMSKEDAQAAKVKQELKATLKRARGARGLLYDLEAEVRGFVEQWEAKQRQLESEGLIEPDSEDEEIVFVGRNGVMSDENRRKQEKALEKDRKIFESLVDDKGAAFGRYLVHSIAQYYGLKTWSITNGNRREAYVGLKTDPQTRRPSLSRLPRPLWTVV